MRKQLLYELVHAPQFRERVYASYGTNQCFWIDMRGEYSQSMDLSPLEGKLREMQQQGKQNWRRKGLSPEKEPVQDVLKRLLPYAEAKFRRMKERMPRSPLMLVEIVYDSVDVETLKNLARGGNLDFAEKAMGKPVLHTTDGLILNSLCRTNTMYANVAHHNSSPSPSYVSIFKQTAQLPTAKEVYHLQFIRSFMTVFGIPQQVTPRFGHTIRRINKLYLHATLLLDPERGIVEPAEEARNALAKLG